MLATGGYRMQARFDTAVNDVTQRTAHWKNVLELLGNDKTNWAVGIGLGAFPRHFILLSPPAERVGTYAYQTQGDNGVLILGGGRDLALGQRIMQPPPELGSLTFSGRLRWREKAGTLGASVCRRRLLEQEAYNGSCSYFRVKPDTSEGVWTPFRIRVDISNLGRNARFTPRFTLLRIGNGQTGSLLEVDDLSLTDAYGTDYLSNGSFEAGGTSWYSYNDFEHLAWHPKNLALAVLVEQGLLGAAAFTGLLLLSLRNARHLARDNLPVGIGILGLTAGIFVLGVFATVIDVPRVAFLLYSVLLIGATTTRASALATRRTVSNGGGPADSSRKKLLT